jgi:predicted GNAT family N-acyltransferase
MNQHVSSLVGSKPWSSPPVSRHHLTQLDSARLAKNLRLSRMLPAQVRDVIDAARPHFPGLTSNPIIRNVLEYNPDCLWTLVSTRGDTAKPVTGFIAMLPLTREGLHLLALRQLDTSNPPLNCICRQGERPAGIYMWAVYLPGRLAGGFSLFVDQLAKPPYDGINLFSQPTTPAGVRFNETLGLHKGVKIGTTVAPHLYESVRAPARPSYDGDSAGAESRAITVHTARSFEDMMKVFAVRSAVYIGEQSCPYEEEFDGNDFCGTHLIGFVGQEPAGCIRIRYFGDFAKIERLAVRKEFRKSRLSFKMVRAAFELCRMKGYRRLYGHSQKRLVDFWGRFGFKVPPGAQELVFSDFDYVEIVAEIEPHPDAVHLGSDAYTIIRPEGQWHSAGILEVSAARPVSSPSIEH